MIQPYNARHDTTERLQGDSFSGLGAAAGSFFGGLTGGVGAAIGGAVSDIQNHQKVSRVITTNLLTGVVAGVFSLKGGPIDSGVGVLVDYVRKSPDASVIKAIDFLDKAKFNNPLVDKLISRAGGKALLLGLTVPMVHRILQGASQGVSLMAHHSSRHDIESYLPENFDRHKYKIDPDSSTSGKFKISGVYTNR